MKFNYKKYFSPIFLLMLLLSFGMWYLTKLSYTYTAEVPVWVDIDGNKFKLECVVEAPGYRIIAHRTFGKSKLNLKFTDVQTTPSVLNDSYYVVNPLSLSSIISLNNSDIRLVSIGDIPEIKSNPIK